MGRKEHNGDYNILFANNAKRRAWPLPAHANFATGFDERATQRNWLLLSADAAATTSPPFHRPVYFSLHRCPAVVTTMKY